MRFSLMISVYNAERYLRACLDSVLAQDYRDFEVLLIDDGSTDNGGKICDSYAEKTVVSVSFTPKTAAYFSPEPMRSNKPQASIFCTWTPTTR